MNFIAVAEKSRKYSSNTAGALEVALKLFEKELNDEEKNSVDIFKDNLDQIYLQVFNKNSSKLKLE